MLKENGISRRGRWMKNKRYIFGIFFTLPAVIGVFWLFLWPMLQSFLMSLSNVAFDVDAGKAVNEYIGLKNYTAALMEDPQYNRYLVTSLVNMATNVPVIVFFSFFAATLINQKFRGRGLARLIFFLPLVISSAAILTLDSTDVFQQSMASGEFKEIDLSTGFLQSLRMEELLAYTGLPDGIGSFILKAIDSVFETISLSGVQIVILLAALQSVPSSLYEMAKVEGATPWEIFWKITFVMISPMLVLCTIYSIIDSFTAYNNRVILAIENQMYGVGNMGLASAMSWIYFGIVTVILLAVAGVGSRLAFYYDK